MDVGDLLEWEGEFWVVRKVEPDLRTVMVEDQDAACQWLDFDALTKFTRLCNPARDWPAVTLPSGRHGRLWAVMRADLADPHLLARFRDWFRFDEFQMGGALYLNPALGLGFRDRLTVTYADGVCASVDIPRVFKPTRQTLITAPAPLAPKPPPVPLLIRLLLEDDDE